MMIAFQVSTRDAQMLAEQFDPPLLLADLTALQKFNAYVRLLIDGMPKLPFSMGTIAPVAVLEKRLVPSLKHCRQR